MKWMYNSGDNDKKTYTYDSTGKGNYSGSRKSTGAYPTYAVNNIYDMAGNVFEWTIEACSTISRGLRGGNYFNYNASSAPASYRSNNNPTYSNSNYGSRLALYM